MPSVVGPAASALSQVARHQGDHFDLGRWSLCFKRLALEPLSSLFSAAGGRRRDLSPMLLPSSASALPRRRHSPFVASRGGHLAGNGTSEVARTACLRSKAGAKKDDNKEGTFDTRERERGEAADTTRCACRSAEVSSAAGGGLLTSATDRSLLSADGRIHGGAEVCQQIASCSHVTDQSSRRRDAPIGKSRVLSCGTRSVCKNGSRGSEKTAAV